MTTKRIKIAALLSNGKSHKNIKIDGYTYLESGFLTGIISSGSKSERTLLTAFSFTGCPIAAHTETHDINPWIWTKGAYKGDRVLQGDGFIVTSELLSRPTSEGIDVKLNMNIQGEIPNIIGIAQPFQEKISQKQPGLLEGEFEVVFLTDKGEFPCTAKTKYTLDTIRNAPTVFRNITILTSDENQQLRQVEQIDLFDNKEAADADLMARLAVN